MKSEPMPPEITAGIVPIGIATASRWLGWSADRRARQAETKPAISAHDLGAEVDRPPRSGCRSWRATSKVLLNGSFSTRNV